MFRVPKYSFSVCQKKLFVIQSKVNIFHQIQPTYSTISLLYFTDMYNILINLDNTYKQYHHFLASLGGHGCLEAGGQEAADGGLEAGAA